MGLVIHTYLSLSTNSGMLNTNMGLLIRTHTYFNTKAIPILHECIGM